jgi:hypothetical protein
MWMFVPDRNGRALRLGIDEAWAQTVTDAFGGIIQQSKARSSSDGMTVLAKIGPVKGMFGRSKGNDIIEAYRFTKDHAKSVAIKSARLAVPICPPTFGLMMAASLTVRTKVHGKAPPAGFRRGLGVRGGGLVVSLP